MRNWYDQYLLVYRVVRKFCTIWLMDLYNVVHQFCTT